MDFIFQGFQSSLPLWSYVLIFIGTSLLAWWSYKDIKGIPALYRYLLIGLRTAVFFVLLVVLLNPFIKKETPYTEPPKLIVMLDNSASVSIEKNSYQGIETYQNVLETLNFSDSSSVNFDFFSIGNATESSSPDSLSFDAGQTNLSQSLQAIQANQSEANAAILISDGIYTQGQNPVFEGENLDIPIFAVGLGDTTTQKDILVRSVSTNSTGYLDTHQPVSATIASNGFEGESFQVQLLDGNEVVSQQTITPEISNSSQEITFELPLHEEGLQQYEIFIPELADEWTGDNNSQRFSVDVQDARQNILSLAFEVHPDVKFIRSLLLKDENSELSKRTWLNGNNFIEDSFDPDPDSVDLAIIHGYPNSGLPSDTEQKLSDLLQDVPVIIVASPLFSPQRFDSEMISLPVTALGSWSYSPVNLNPQEQSNSHPIMELPNVSYEQLPDLSAPIKNIENGPGTTPLFNSSFRGESTQNPVLVVQELGNKRMALLTAFGWFRFNQNSNPQTRTFGRELLLNIVSWTATDPDNRLLEVEPAQTTFSGSENVEINAYLTNERGEVENDATVDLSVSSDTADARFYSMENVGSGRYRLDLGTMPEGIYSFEATAEKGNRQLDSREGEFAVARSNAEFMNTVRNDQLLRQLAERTGGSYVPYDSLSTFWDDLDQRGLLDQNEEYQTNFFYPYQHIGWFLLALLLLASEWIMRKYFSLP